MAHTDVYNITVCLLAAVFLLIPSVQPCDAQADDAHWSRRFADPSMGFIQALAADEEAAFITGNFRLPTGESGSGIVRWDAQTREYRFIAHLQPVPERDGNGWIMSAVVTPDRVFFGGLFNLGDGTRHLAVWNREDQSWIDHYESLDHRIADIAVGDDGTLYVLSRYTIDRRAPWYSEVFRWTGNGWESLGGRYERYTNTITAGSGDVYLAEEMVRRWNGSHWAAVGSAEGEVTSLVVSTEGTLYAGGDFSSIGGVTTEDIARWNGTTWHSMDGGAGRRASAAVHDLMIHDGNLYAAGRIDSVGGQPVNNLAMWDGERWSEVGGGTNGDVFDLSQGESRVYISGSFEMAGSSVAHNFAAREPSSNEWRAMYDALGQGVRGSIHALSYRSDGDLIAAGKFSAAGNTAARNIAAWNGASWDPLGQGVRGNIATVTQNEGTVYAGGRLSRPGDSLQYGLAIWDSQENGWKYIVEDDHGQRAARLHSLLVYNDTLHAAGRVRTGESSSVRGLFRWDGSNWAIVGEIEHDSRSAVATNVAVGSDGMIYLGGRFTTVDNTEARGIARWDGSSWSALGNGLLHTVSALGVTNTHVYAAAGSYGSGGIHMEADSLYIWDRSSRQWSPTTTGLSVRDDCMLVIKTIEAAPESVYVGGGGGICTAEEIGEPSDWQTLSRWNGEKWTSLGSGLTGGPFPSNSVNDLALHGSDLYVGGSFQEAGGRSSLNIARWNTREVLDRVEPSLPNTVRLHPNYPNPFNPSTTIRYSIPFNSTVQLTVYDATGRRVAVLVDRMQTAGSHRIRFDGSSLPSGLYFYRLQTNTTSQSRPMLLIK